MVFMGHFRFENQVFLTKHIAISIENPAVERKTFGFVSENNVDLCFILNLKTKKRDLLLWTASIPPYIIKSKSRIYYPTLT